FRLKIPAAFKNVEISGANIRRRDRNGEEWRVELQNKLVGQHVLTVTWEQSWSVKEQGAESPFDVTGVEALGVERETGMVAVIAKSQLQITTKSAGAELIRADVQELPDWAGRADLRQRRQIPAHQRRGGPRLARAGCPHKKHPLGTLSAAGLRLQQVRRHHDPRSRGGAGGPHLQRAGIQRGGTGKEEGAGGR